MFKSIVFLFLCMVSSLSHADLDHSIPFVYVHGVGAPHQLFTTVYSLEKEFARMGRTLYVARTPATQNYDAAARSLQHEIQRLVPSGPYILIGHSMGGLVARATLTKGGEALRCLALVTISTPHLGSPVADWAWSIVTGSKQQELKALDKKLLEQIMIWVNGSLTVLRELTTDYMQEHFSVRFAKQTHVKYFSIGHYIPFPQIYFTQNPYLLATHRINMNVGLESDGPVPLASARYGVHLGDFPGDHYSTQGPIPFGVQFIHHKSFDRMLLLLDEHF